MKKFILMLMLCFCTVGAFAQNEYVGSKFTDNMSVTLQGGVGTKLDAPYQGHTQVVPEIVFSIDKFITPYVGFGIDARTSIGTGCELHNTKTAFDAVSAMGYLKFNLSNILCPNVDGKHFFDVIPYAGLGWSQATASTENGDHINYMNFRPGCEFRFNAWKKVALVANASVNYRDINNGKLNIHNGGLETTVGCVYYIGQVGWKKHKCTEYVREVIREIPSKPIEIVKTKVVEAENYFSVTFAQNSSDLTSEARAILDKVPTNVSCHVTASTSPEGSAKRNAILQQERAVAVANYLTARGIRCTTGTAEDARQATIVVTQR